MNLLSLCAGYGGLDMALETFGFTTRWVADIDPYASKVLGHRFRDVPNLGDIHDLPDLEDVDAIAAGYPCQPFSHAGRRKGTEDDRHIWPAIARTIRVLRPRYVFLENVAGHLSLGGPEVVGSLAGMGYVCRWGVVRASDTGAPHRRARWFCVATHPEDNGLPRPRPSRAQDRREGPGDLALLPTPTATYAGGSYQRHLERKNRTSLDSVTDLGMVVEQLLPTPTAVAYSNTFAQYARAVERWAFLTRPAPEPSIDGRLNPVFVEWMMGLPEGWVTDVDLSRTAQLRILGNGVVPQQAELAYSLLLKGHADVS